MAERKAVIKNADMAEDMQQDAVECATQVSSFSLLPVSSYLLLLPSVLGWVSIT